MIKLIVKIGDGVKAYAVGDEMPYQVGETTGGHVQGGLYLVVANMIAVTRELTGSGGDSVHVTVFLPVGRIQNSMGQEILSPTFEEAETDVDVADFMESIECDLAEYRSFAHDVQSLLSGVFYMDDINNSGIVLGSAQGHYNTVPAQAIRLCGGW